MPASRSARAMTFAPRSWPSSPGLAITTRIFWLIRSTTHQITRSSDDRHFLVFSPYFAERIAHFADRGIGAHAIEQQRHGVGGAPGAGLQRFERAADAIGIARAL